MSKSRLKNLFQDSSYSGFFYILKFWSSLIPLIVMVGITIFFSIKEYRAGQDNLNFALVNQSDAKLLLPLIQEQESAMLTLLLDPLALSDVSEKKLAAYDKHRELLDRFLEDKRLLKLKPIVDELHRIDDMILKPLETKILELLYEDVEKAKNLYFEKFSFERKKYEIMTSQLVSTINLKSKEIYEENARNTKTRIIRMTLELGLGIVIVMSTMLFMAFGIRRSNSNTNRLLIGIPEGLFFFDRFGKIAKERSKKLKTVLPESHKYSDIFELIHAFDRNFKKSTMDMCLRLLWPNADDSGIYSEESTTLSLLPKKISFIKDHQIRNIQFDFKPVHGKNGNLEFIVVSAQDITEKLILLEQKRNQAMKISRLTKAAGNIEDYKLFESEIIKNIKSTESLIKTKDSCELIVLKRNLHTLKGNLSIFNFISLSEKIHDLETHICEDPTNIDYRVELFEKSKNQWSFESKDIRTKLGLNENELSLSVNKQNFYSLINSSFQSKKELLVLDKKIADLRRFPINFILERFSKYTENLQKKIKDKKFQLNFEQDSCQISHEEGRNISNGLTHILRNCFDHGIETVAKRVEIGKSEVGIVTISCFRGQNKLVFYISDDGAGIDGEKLANKAVKNHLWTKNRYETASQQEKLDLVFQSGLSSKDVATELSGRGIGMDAVKTEIEAQGGKILLHSRMGEGVQFKIILIEEITDSKIKSTFLNTKRIVND